jgi:hypothetical protein
VGEIQLVTLDEVKSFAHNLVEESKEDLVARGRIWRRCYVFTSTDRLPPGQKTASETAGALVMIDLEADAAGLLKMFEAIEPRYATLKPKLRELARMTGVSEREFAPRTIAILLQLLGLREHQLVTRYTRHMVEKLGAYAYVHVADSWWAESKDSDRSKLAADLSKEPTAREALVVSVEMRRYQEVTSVPYRRAERGEGKVLGFDEPHVITSADGAAKIGGQLLGILRDLPLN